MMKRPNATRIAAATGVVAMAAAGVVALGQGAATAAQGSYSWSDGNDGLTRVISDVTPTVGETITVTTTIKRNGGVDEYVQAAKDAHPACWQYVSGSAQVNGTARGVDSSSTGDANNMGWQKVSGSWGISAIGVIAKSVSFSFKYVIGANCPTGTPMKGSFFYSGTLGDGNENNVGPEVTVRAATSTTTTVDPITDAVLNQQGQISAMVSPAPGGGTVQFKDNGQDIGGPATVDPATGKATQSWAPVFTGRRQITAVFSGANGYDGSTSAAVTVSIGSGGGTANSGSLSNIFGS